VVPLQRPARVVVLCAAFGALLFDGFELGLRPSCGFSTPSNASPINSSRIDSLALTFAKDGTAAVELAYYGRPLRIPIGLDGVYRIGPHGPFGLPADATGTWRSEAEFLLDVNFIANINHYTLGIKLLPDRTIEVSASEASGLIRNGTLIGTPR
jgi:hypothetical protein